MQRRSSVTRAAVLATWSFCSLPLIADDPFAGGDPFVTQAAVQSATGGKPTMGVTALSVAKPTPRDFIVKDEVIQVTN